MVYIIITFSISVLFTLIFAKNDFYIAKIQGKKVTYYPPNRVFSCEDKNIYSAEYVVVIRFFIFLVGYVMCILRFKDKITPRGGYCGIRV